MNVLQIHTIETERLLLRAFTPDTFRLAYDFLTDEELKELFCLPDDEALALERARYQQGMSTYNRSFVNFQLHRKDSGELIGSCGFHTWYLPHARAEIGYALGDDRHKGQGFMKEAMKEVVNYGFHKMNLHRIEAFISPNNVPSLRLVKHFGFQHEGVLRQHYCKDNKMEDSLVFSLLKSEHQGS